jgi:hypothetical protein
MPQKIILTKVFVNHSSMRVLSFLIWSFVVSLLSQASAKTWVDCSSMFANPDTGSYFVSSDAMAAVNWISGAYAQSFSTANKTCTGALTTQTRFAVLKPDSGFAKDLVTWLEYVGWGLSQSYVALTKAANGSWYWDDGSNEFIDSTYWAPSQPSTGSCAVLNAYTPETADEYLLTSVSCDSTMGFICEIPGEFISYFYFKTVLQL